MSDEENREHAGRPGKGRCWYRYLMCIYLTLWPSQDLNFPTSANCLPPLSPAFPFPHALDHAAFQFAISNFHFPLSKFQSPISASAVSLCYRAAVSPRHPNALLWRRREAHAGPFEGWRRLQQHDLLHRAICCCPRCQSLPGASHRHWTIPKVLHKWLAVSLFRPHRLTTCLGTPRPHCCTVLLKVPPLC